MTQVHRPHIRGELLKLGFAVAQSTVAKYMAKKGEYFEASYDRHESPRGA